MNEWVCIKCEWTGPETDIIKKKIFSGSREEPEEWLWFCPNCDSTDGLDDKSDYFWCRDCQEERVDDEGDRCPECYALHVERHTDAARGH